MSWHRGRLALFDTETTGVDPREDRIVTAAILLVGGGQPTIRRSWMLRCTRPIPDGAAAIHGITTEHANTHGIDHAVGVGAIAEELVQASSLGIPIVGHNVAYDVTILRAELQRHGHTRLAEQVSSIEPVIDTYVCDKWVDPYRKGSRRLVDISNHYGVPLDESDAHGAEAPARGEHGGRLLAQDGITVELAIAESGTPPTYRAWLYRDGKPLPATAGTVEVRLVRLGGVRETHTLVPQADGTLARRYQQDAAHRWLRAQLQDVLASCLPAGSDALASASVALP